MSPIDVGSGSHFRFGFLEPCCRETDEHGSGGGGGVAVRPECTTSRSRASMNHGFMARKQDAGENISRPGQSPEATGRGRLGWAERHQRTYHSLEDKAAGRWRSTPQATAQLVGLFCLAWPGHLRPARLPACPPPPAAPTPKKKAAPRGWWACSRLRTCLHVPRRRDPRALSPAPPSLASANLHRRGRRLKARTETDRAA